MDRSFCLVTCLNFFLHYPLTGVKWQKKTLLCWETLLVTIGECVKGLIMQNVISKYLNTKNDSFLHRKKKKWK